MESKNIHDGNITVPWKTGYYRNSNNYGVLWYIEGENITMDPAAGKPTNQEYSMSKGTLKYGKFADAPADIAKKSGKLQYNVELTLWAGAWKRHGVVCEDSSSIYYPGMSHDVDQLDWLSDKELSEFLASGDPFDAMPHDYKVQPENQGKLLWLSGAPGLGKSTCGIYLSKNEGYVYYEADSFMSQTNPYVPKDVDETTLASFSRNFLSGVPQERLDLVATGRKNFVEMINGNEYDFNQLCKFYTSLSEDIKNEKKRIGGDFAVTHAVPLRKFRDHIRKVLGCDVIFVVFHMSKEHQLKRLQARHGNDDTAVQRLTKCYDLFEPAAEDEPNTISLLINEKMSKDDVVEKIIELVSQHNESIKTVS